MATINPYLTFKGNCEEAFVFYQSIIGGENTSFSRFSDMPPDPNFPISEALKNQIMHVSLPISDETILMGSDAPDTPGRNFTIGNNITLSIQTNSRSETDQIFRSFSNGGNITMPLAETFWDAYFGMCIDKFGINWMINCEIKTNNKPNFI